MRTARKRDSSRAEFVQENSLHRPQAPWPRPLGSGHFLAGDPSREEHQARGRLTSGVIGRPIRTSLRTDPGEHARRGAQEPEDPRPEPEVPPFNPGAGRMYRSAKTSRLRDISEQPRGLGSGGWE